MTRVNDEYIKFKRLGEFNLFMHLYLTSSIIDENQTMI